MATNRAQREPEEAFSLCDVPVNLIKDNDQLRKPDSQVIETQEEFDFHLWGGPFSKEPEMCAADEVFFQGQILPLRLSSASDRLLQGYGRKIDRCKSRSDSVDHGNSLSESRSNSYSSRSSSLRSQNSSNSTSSTNIITTPSPNVSKPINHNRFHTHPSPKPQFRMSIPRQASFGHVGKKTTTWDFFRLGVVPAPEIELQDLKVRGTKNSVSVSRNSSTSNSSSNSGTTQRSKSCNSTHYRDKSNHGLKQFVVKGGGFLSGCKCSSSIETEPLDTVTISSGAKSDNKTKSVTHAMKEKVVLELKKQKQKQKQGKKAMSRRRTFEWLKELSHASYLEEKALLLNS